MVRIWFTVPLRHSRFRRQQLQEFGHMPLRLPQARRQLWLRPCKILVIVLYWTTTLTTIWGHGKATRSYRQARLHLPGMRLKAHPAHAPALAAAKTAARPWLRR